MSVHNDTPNEETQPNANPEQPQDSSEQTDTAQQMNEDHIPAEAPPIDEFKEKFVRLYAEFENYRKRTNQERLDLIVTANGGLLKELLAVLDDFDRAITNNEQLDDAVALREGFKLLQTKFKQILLSKGLKEMLAKGQPFDSDLHEAIASVAAPDDSLKGKVVEDIEKGYYLNDKVLRFAKVLVGQ